MLVIRTVPIPDVECVVVRRGDDVIVYVAESLLSSHAASSISQALSAAGVGRAHKAA